MWFLMGAGAGSTGLGLADLLVPMLPTPAQIPLAQSLPPIQRHSEDMLPCRCPAVIGTFATPSNTLTEGLRTMGAQTGSVC